MVAAFRVACPRRQRRASSVNNDSDWSRVSEPLGPDERREEVDNDGGSHRNSDVGHRMGSSDFFAGVDESVANAQADEPERKQRRQPNDQIHRSLLSSGTTFKGRAEAAGK
jgi:hypothetical protein